ncbi:hypothetical protein ACGU0V_000851 [Serratia marcescens]
MATNVTAVEQIHVYAKGVMERVDHHAGNVGGVALVLLGGVIWRAEPKSIKIYEVKGKMTNVIWWTSSFTGDKYVLSYNHLDQSIEIKDQKINGEVLHSLSNKTAVTDALEIISAL